jgi:hypothetical protein
MANSDPINPVPLAHRIGDAVQRIPGNPINPLHTCGSQNIDKNFCNLLSQSLPPSIPNAPLDPLTTGAIPAARIQDIDD